ncbi:pyruvate:ferredoxin (flavodoxin) oxidoreductase [Paludisphaera mucosa]|uniref:Pyruvate:ferredoxin (Flavodoxin) oxidoreductase n=1 Tax=Paludisphaera mucosa TaxID=3030827 RepID=A0ABT6FFW1_9BACT|nr:pyruvate:ferredoxin (flavodoxin) oxidoreductase [Paludisphaera mucosa]MDG3006458.1 pyruvate:ferredoxin (flavodoxin) oxidoreductase [Paludisphaera mucosa]
MKRQYVTVDGNEAAAYVAHATNEVIAIYPITPSSTMGELADAWSAVGRKNIYDVVPTVVEMQSEGGAAGACHGGLQGGALTTTFTASQGLLLMIPNMYKIAGELTSVVFHVAARSLATHALSIFGDHSDVMSTRGAGWAMLCSNTPQEVQDFALIAQGATLKARVPVLHFFDGFRTSHEVNKLEQLTRDDLRAMIPDDLVQAHRDRALSPERPILRGTAQNPDVFFQAREACNPYYQAVPGIVQQVMDDFEKLAGRRYQLFEYVGAPDAEFVAVAMGSGCGAIEETIARLNAEGRKLGLIKIRLFRPFDVAAFLAVMPTTTRRIAALDRTKEPGAIGEPLYQDVVTALAEGWADRAGDAPIPRVYGGRYGLSSKDFTPAMVKGVFDELATEAPKKHFTVGIIDDVTHLSLKWDPTFSTEAPDVHRAVFYGLGSDGTVGANKNTVKIIGENTPFHAQGYFVYDSKKSGSVTVSHLRFSPRPIQSSYLVYNANFVACHQFNFLERIDVLECADPGAVFLLNSPYGPDEIWDKMPIETQRQILEKKLRFYVIDAEAVAQKAGLGRRINTIMQTCFFALSGVLPREEAIAEIKHAIEKTYGKRGEAVLEQNYAGVDHALAHLHEVTVPSEPAGDVRRVPAVPAYAPDFVKRVTAMMIEGRGDLLPVSALPVDGSFPTATAQYEKRSIALSIPIWDPEICIQCGLCALVCPHAAIRTKAYPQDDLVGGPDGFPSLPFTGKELPGSRLTVQVAPDDCTGCGVCVDVCPARSKESVKHKAVNMEPKVDHLDRERANFDFFLALPEADRSQVKIEVIKGSQLLQPLFEFSGACPGCGETPYLKLMSQLFGDRAMIANATGCSSIYGGNLPTTPYTTNASGRGPAWSNSLFEDNAEFGLGLRLAVDQQEMYARELVRRLAPQLGSEFVAELLDSPQLDDAGIAAQRERVTIMKQALEGEDAPGAIALKGVADSLIRRSVWIVGGDGWAYDIGFGGLDHVLASGRDVNILVLDTEVYSNTGGQASKSTPRAAVAKFASGGKTVGKKDLGMMAVDYGNVYVATVSMGANPLQTLKAFREAESYPGTSLIIAYSTCIAHGIDMTTSMAHQKDAVSSGYWPLYRYDPRVAQGGAKPFHLDSRKPSTSFRDFALKEGRYAMLARANPTHSENLLALAQADITERWHFYEQMAGVERNVNPMEESPK